MIIKKEPVCIAKCLKIKQVILLDGKVDHKIVKKIEWIERLNEHYTYKTYKMMITKRLAWITSEWSNASEAKAGSPKMFSFILDSYFVRFLVIFQKMEYIEIFAAFTVF